MAVKVVTDSTADIPPQITKELGIVVVPLSVNFGDEVYLDGMNLSADEFFHKLTQSPSLPITSQPPIGAFAQVYSDLAAETDEIISIHISAKLSGTYNSALGGREMVGKSCHIEIIDSLQVSMGLGFIVIAAARAAQNGASLDQVTGIVTETIPRTHYFGMLDTLEYLKKGGRIGKAQAFLGTLLNFKPILACRNGEVHPLERVRTRRRALERMVELAADFKDIAEMTILHSTTPDEAKMLAERLAPIFPRSRLYQARIGPVMGVYLGPGAITLALVEGTGKHEPER